MLHSYEFPVYSRLDLEIVAGNGSRVTTRDGRELIDFYGAHAVAALGYRHPEMLRAIVGQAEELLFQTNLVEVEVRQQACEALARLAPGDLDRVFLVNSGAEANENALRLAFHHTAFHHTASRQTTRGPSRTGVVVLEGGFHGRTAAAGACSQGALEAWYAFPRTPFDVARVSRDDPQALAAAVDDNTAAVILEPVQGLAGAIDLDVEMLRAAKAATERHGALLIADEVQCGMGRTGTAFAIEAAGVVPDILTTAKGLAGGFPAGAVIASARLADAVPKGAMGTTFGGGPMACACMLTVIETLNQPGFMQRVADLGERIRSTCQVGPVVDIQGRGLLLGLRCDRPARDVLEQLRGRGILAGGAGDPEIVRLMPPLTVGDAEVEALRQALDGITAGSEVRHRTSQRAAT